MKKGNTMKKTGRYNVYGFENLVDFYKENLDFEGERSK